MVVKEVLFEERKNKRALSKYKRLPFPCKCGAICSFSEYVAPIIRCFDLLYADYIKLHRDYTLLFNATWIRVKDGNHKGNSALTYTSHLPPPEASELPKILDFDRIRRVPLETTNSLTFPMFTNTRINENSLREEVIRSRIRQRLLKRTFLTSLWCHIYAHKTCLCLNCDYRDCVVDYNEGVKRLKDEYDRVFSQYEALFTSVDVLPSEESRKIIFLSQQHYENLKERDSSI